MKLTPQEKTVIEIIRNISGENVDRIDNILRALMMYSLMNYAEGESIIIPYFGRFKIQYKGDKVSVDGREAQLETFYAPSQEVRINIGFLEDAKKSGNLADITKIPIIKEVNNASEMALRGVLNDSSLNEPIEE